jgi:hypothetical protein
MVLDRDVLLKKGWRRHSVVRPEDEAFSALLEHFPESMLDIVKRNRVVIILVTYDCAIVSPDFHSEPWLHVLLAFEVECNKQFTKGRNPRKIHFTLDLENETLWFEANAASIAQLPRKPLLNFAHSAKATLSEESKYDLLNWLSERFKLVTWPDNFNKALSSADKKIKSLWKKYDNYFSGLYIKLNTLEEVSPEQYRIAIIVALDEGKLRKLILKVRESESSLVNCSIDEAKSKVINEIRNVFSGKINIEADPTMQNKLAIELIEEKSFTLAQLRHFSRFSPYSLSEYNVGGKLPVDMLSTVRS